MAENRFRCSNCPHTQFSTLLEAVRHVVSERDRRGKHVQCCVRGCSKTVRKLRLHIRKFHEEFCSLSCSTCPAKFVEQEDLNNHHRNGCYLRKNIIETFFEHVDFSVSSAVNDFIAKKLQLDKPNRDAISLVVDKLYKHLQDELPSSFSIDIHNLVKGGSVGKGTAVKDKADIDCVVFLNNMNTMKEHKDKLKETKNSLQSCLEQSPFKYQITFHEQTPFAVKFNFRLDLSREFDIDLLPTFTTVKKPEQLYKEMIGCATKNKGYYSAHFVSLQVKFVGVQPSFVKDLIRLVKYWRKTCIEDKSIGKKTRLPSSYPLELITIKCWQNAGKPSFDIRAGFKAVLQQLVDYCHIHFVWYEYYDEAVAERGIKGMKMSERRRPFVLDPANPTNNVCIRGAGDVKGWKIVAAVANETLQRLNHALKGISFDENWQIEQV